MTIRQILIAIAVGLSVGVSSVLASTGTDGVLTMLEADDLAVVAHGETIYQAHCAACHGVQLEGQPNWQQRDAQGLLPAPPHDASGHTWHHADDLLFEITKYGPGVVIEDTDYQSAMPAFANILSDEDIVAVLSFIKNSWPAEERQWQEEVNGSQIGSQLPKTKRSTQLDEFLK